MKSDKEKFRSSLLPILYFVLFLWLIKILEVKFNFSLSFLGLEPLTVKGLIGIITAPMLHGSYSHLFSNTIPLIVLGTGVFYFFPKSSKNVIPLLWLVPGVIVWFIGRPSYHIGSSGLIYGLVTFIFFSGTVRKDKRSITLALLVTFLYGGIIWGIFPLKEGVSWEYHLAGAVIGIILAVVNKKNDPLEELKWDEDDENLEDGRKLEVDWSKPPPW